MNFKAPMLTEISDTELSCDSGAVLEGGSSNTWQGVQCNLSFLEVKLTNPKCHMSHSYYL